MRTKSEGEVNRWVQLVCGIVCMVMVANLQYGWTLFVNPIDSKYHWGRAAIQVAFSIFVATETWLVPVEGWFVDRFGPRIVVSFGGVLVAIAWTLDAHATSLPLLYIAGALAGIGAGAVYGTCVGNALKWFPDRRGLAAGLTAAAFGAAISVVPIRDVIEAYGYETAFQWFGIGQGIVVLLLAQFLVAPTFGQVRAPSKLRISSRNFTAAEMLRTPVFWLMYVMFVMVAASGLMVTAQVAPIARDYKIANVILIFGASTLTVALIVDNILNGLARPFFGWGPITSDANIPWPSCSLSAQWRIGCLARSAISRLHSCSPPVLFTSLGARFTVCSRRRVRTPTAPPTQPPMLGFCTRPKARLRGLCRSQTCSKPIQAVGTPFSWSQR
jgi:MFS transporter, OFA family, oxalate/formate antiporter